MESSSSKIGKIIKSNKVWIIIIFIIIVLAVGLGIYLYFFYYLKPNFGDDNFNYISQDKQGKIKPGETITYTINFKNTGNVMVNDLVILAPMPENTTFLYSGNNAEFDLNKNMLEFMIGNLNKNEGEQVSYAVEVKKPLDNGTLVKNREIVFRYKRRGKEGVYKLTTYLENVVESTPDFTKLSIEMIDDNGGKLSMGDIVTFNINLENTGNMNATDVEIIDKIPSKVEILDDSIKLNGKYDSNSKEIIWTLDKLNIEDPKRFTFKARIGDNFNHLESFNNSVEVKCVQNVENTASMDEAVWLFPNFSESTIYVEDVNGGSVWSADTLKYTIKVKNSGERTGENLQLYCLIPVGTNYISRSGTVEGISWNDEIGGLQWDIERVGIEEEKVFTFNVVINSSMVSGGRIGTEFYIEEDGQETKIEPAYIDVRSNIFQTVVCMGDSQIVATNWPSILDQLLEGTYPHVEFNTVASGVPGDEAYYAVKRFDATVGSYHPQIIVIGYGTNDAGGGTSSFQHYLDMLVKKAKSTGATILVHSIGYMDIKKVPEKVSYIKYNDIIKSVCSSNGVPYIDLYNAMLSDPGRYLQSDGMHLSSEGGSLLAHLVFNTLVNYLDENGQRK